MPSPTSAAAPLPSVHSSGAGFGPIVLSRGYLLLAALCVGLTLLAQLLDVGADALDNAYLVALGGLFSLMLLVRALYARAARFLFSPSFWLLVTFLFYFVLKSLDLWGKDAHTATLVEALWLCSLFLLSYAVTYAVLEARRRGRPATATIHGEQAVAIAPGASWILLAIYGAFKLLGIALFAAAGGGNALEVSAATQNAGAAYLYRLPTVGNILFLVLLYDSFKHNRGWAVLAVAVAFYLAEAFLSTSRLSLVLIVMWSAFLYHRYRHPISLGRVALIGVPLALVTVLFGYARNLEVGSVDAYSQAAEVLLADPTLISDLFMQRLDMLPELVTALDLHKAGVLPDLNGASYVYAFLHSIPRSLWEAKPLLTAALVTSETHPGAFADGVNIFPSMVFEGYMNLSYLGIVISGAIVAWMCVLLERLIEADRLVPSVFALSLLTFPMALFNEGFHSNYTGNLLYITALTALLYQALRLFGLLRRRVSAA